MNFILIVLIVTLIILIILALCTASGDADEMWELMHKLNKNKK